MPRLRFVPEGLLRIAQCFKHWVSGVGASSPVGTAECGCGSQHSQPSRWDSFCCLSPPSVETLGYYRLSLRDNDTRFRWKSPRRKSLPSKVLGLI